MARYADDRVSGVQKAAILLIALGPEKSATIFKHLKEEEIEEEELIPEENPIPEKEADMVWDFTIDNEVSGVRSEEFMKGLHPLPHYNADCA